MANMDDVAQPGELAGPFVEKDYVRFHRRWARGATYRAVKGVDLAVLERVQALTAYRGFFRRPVRGEHSPTGSDGSDPYVFVYRGPDGRRRRQFVTRAWMDQATDRAGRS